MKKEEKGTHGELVNDMMHPHWHAGVPSLGSTARVHVNPIDGCQYSNELRAHMNLTNDHKKKEKTTPKACPDASTWFHVMFQQSSSVLS